MMVTSKEEVIDTLLMLVVWGRQTNDEEMIMLCTRKIARLSGSTNIDSLVLEWESRSKPKRKKAS